MKPPQLCTIFYKNLAVKSYFANFLEQIDPPKRMQNKNTMTAFLKGTKNVVLLRKVKLKHVQNECSDHRTFVFPILQTFIEG